MGNTSNYYCSLHAMREVQHMLSFLPRSISVDRQLTARIIGLFIIRELENCTYELPKNFVRFLSLFGRVHKIAKKETSRLVMSVSPSTRNNI
jgi:hypothetical protein